MLLAQDMPVSSKTNLVTYQEVVSEEGDKIEFYNRANTWLGTYYKNAFSVTTLRKKDEGVIKGKHQFQIFDYEDDSVRVVAGFILYKFNLEFKEGRYRYTMTDFVMRKKTRLPIEDWLTDEAPEKGAKYPSYLMQINAYAENWVESLKKGMKPVEVKVEEEW